MKHSREDVLKLVKDRGIKFVQLWFTDIHGQLKSFSIASEQLETVLEDGQGFDGSSIKGYARIDESDMVAKPDPATFQLLPWRPEEKSEGRMFADVLTPDGEPYEGDPRYALKKNLKKLDEKGYTFCVGPELEYFYFKNEKKPEVLDEGGYFDLTTLDAADNLRRETILALQAMGVAVEYSHHEVAPSQHEIDLRYNDALTMADNVMTYRIVVKEIASKYGFYATFMPKPIFGKNGSGMHVHQSLFKGKKNAFFDPEDNYHLSGIAKGYAAGILSYASEITAVTNQWVNSYKRLVLGYEAPVYVSWGRRNRSTLVRVPMHKAGKEEAVRIEYRSPDPACNPYLAFSVMLAAGLKGIEDSLELPKPVERDIYSISVKEREDLGIKSLPGSLIEAIELTEDSKLVRDALGEHIFHNFIVSKKVEWNNYRIQVHPYEVENYLPVL